jgi:hypothetical protein
LIVFGFQAKHLNQIISELMQKLTIIFLATVLFSGGCDFIESINPFAESTDTLEIYRQRQDSIRSAELLRIQQQEARLEQARADSVQRIQDEAQILKVAERYHLIVGAFRTPLYATDFQNVVRTQGHDSRILMSDNNFHLVTARSLNDYRTALNELAAIRNQGEHYDAWLYITE